LHGDTATRTVDPSDILSESKKTKSPKKTFISQSYTPTLSNKDNNVLFEQLSAVQLQASATACGPETTDEPGPNMFITGGAGTGKSTILRYIIKKLAYKYGPDAIGITAPTGVAAINVSGQTIHSFFGIGLAKGSKSALLKKVMKDEKARSRIMQTKVLVIDEISMVSNRKAKKTHSTHHSPLTQIYIYIYIIAL